MRLLSLQILLALLPFGSAFNTALGKRQRIFEIEQQAKINNLRKREVDPALLYPTYNLSVPVDHFYNDSTYEPHTNATFPLRYWFDASHYQPGGPVIVLQGGETDGSGRLVYLQKGLLAQMAKVTNGIGVVLEHRYYGESWPTSDLSTKNLRFLTTAQALADEAYFAKNIVFPGLENLTLTSDTNAYIGYGGSYAGAFNAFLRVQYPDVFWGTISSSGVTKAIWDYWQYFTPIAENAPPTCVAAQKTLTHIVDNILIGKNSSQLTYQLKKTFGMENVTYDDDFAAILSEALGYWQSRNWDPAVNSPDFYEYCGNISTTSVLYPDTTTLRTNVSSLITAGQYTASDNLINQMLNLVGYINLTQVAPCAQQGATQNQCFSTHNSTFYAQDDISQTWRSWPYQYCTEWGFLQTGSGVPADQLPLVSRTLDLEYESLICREAFNISKPANIEVVNKYGGYDVSYPRLAFVDGSADPWRPATPHAFAEGAKHRNSTASEPFILIDGAVHHWDENGLFPNQTTSELPPPPVANTQKQELQFVQEWMEEWKQQRLNKGVHRVSPRKA
ncbi:hypothetical protein AAFC00_002845 [Neodothiora populina]|uniref:Extracelular serine carboxypeptidase n=1 Tax=Neodothiora populina TaxID=2781224 RepID=A0ABR3P963_9PEZI